MARNVVYQAAWIAELCRRHPDWDFDIQPHDGAMLVPVSSLVQGAPNSSNGNLPDLSAALNLSPRRSVRLLSDLYARVDDPQQVWTEMQAMANDPNWHLPGMMAVYRPAVFVSGARHYSLTKAVEMLGLGGGALWDVKTDTRHRMDVHDLETQIRRARDNGRIPLAVVAIIGTTEEGAVDPLPAILDLRRRIEQSEKPASFWVHADAAWGGYLATLGNLPPRTRALIKARVYQQAVTGQNTADYPGEMSVHWLEEFVGTCLGTNPPSDVVRRAYNQAADALRSDSPEVDSALDHLVTALGPESNQPIAPLRQEKGQEPGDDYLDAAIKQQQEFVDAHIVTRHEESRSQKTAILDEPLVRADPDVIRACLRLKDADSVTVDPHKMGYQHYACGAIAFRDDRCRLYVRQRAPYLTKLEQQARQPLVHVERKDDGEYSVKIESHGSYTLEGSRASAPATALWLATEVLPLRQDGHGKVVRDSWRAARHLYNLLVHWESHFENKLYVDEGQEPHFRFVVLTAGTTGEPLPPDTNLVIFGAVPTRGRTLARYNQLTDAIYRRFSISYERGEKQHSYSQPFFLSNTTFDHEYYPAEALKPVATVAGIEDFDEEYRKPGVTMSVLRATVMNPYLWSLAVHKRTDILKDFMVEMARVARTEAAAM